MDHEKGTTFGVSGSSLAGVERQGQPLPVARWRYFSSPVTTDSTPSCLLVVDDEPAISWSLDDLERVLPQAHNLSR